MDALERTCEFNRTRSVAGRSRLHLFLTQPQMGEVLVEEVAGEELHSLQFGRVGDDPVPPESRERIGHLIQNPLLVFLAEIPPFYWVDGPVLSLVKIVQDRIFVPAIVNPSGA